MAKRNSVLEWFVYHIRLWENASIPMREKELMNKVEDFGTTPQAIIARKQVLAEMLEAAYD